MAISLLQLLELLELSRPLLVAIQPVLIEMVRRVKPPLLRNLKWFFVSF